MIVLAYHLLHGFQSAFRSLGIYHKKYTPVIEFLGIAFSIIVPAVFAAMPIYFLLKNDSTVMALDSKIPSGPLGEKWSQYKSSVKLVNPANKKRLTL